MATGSNFLPLSLQQELDEELYQYLEDLPYENGMAIPTLPDLNPGAESVAKKRTTVIGKARIIADRAWDIPRVRSVREKVTYLTYAIMDSFSVTYRESLAMEFTQTTQREAVDSLANCRRVIAEAASDFAAFGQTDLGVTGLLNNPSVTVVNDNFNIYTASPNDVKSFLFTRASMITDGSNGSFGMGYVLTVPWTVYSSIYERMLPDSSLSIAQGLIGDGRFIADIIPSADNGFVRLEANGVNAPGTNKDRIVAYPNNKTIVERHVSLPERLPDQWAEVRDGEMHFPVAQFVTPTMINTAAAISYTEIPKKS